MAADAEDIRHEASSLPHDAKKRIYDELDTKEGQVKIYKIAKARKDPGK